MFRKPEQMPWLLGVVPPLVIFHSSRGVVRWQHTALGATLLSRTQPPQEQWRGVGSAALPASLAPAQKSLASPQCPGRKRLPGVVSSVKQNPLSILSGNSAWGRWNLTVFLFPLVFNPCLKPPLGSFSLPEVSPQLLPPRLLYLPTHLQLSSP